MHIGPQLMVVGEQALNEILGSLAHVGLGIKREWIVLQQEMAIGNRLLVNTSVERSPAVQHFIEYDSCKWEAVAV